MKLKPTVPTLNPKSTIIVVNPRMASHFLVCPMFLNKVFHASINSLAGPGMPKSCLSCELAICNAAAVVKPDITGNEKNSTKKPEIGK